MTRVAAQPDALLGTLISPVWRWGRVTPQRFYAGKVPRPHPLATPCFETAPELCLSSRAVSSFGDRLSLDLGATRLPITSRAGYQARVERLSDLSLSRRRVGCTSSKGTRGAERWDSPGSHPSACNFCRVVPKVMRGSSAHSHNFQSAKNGSARSVRTLLSELEAPARGASM